MEKKIQTAIPVDAPSGFAMGTTQFLALFGVLIYKYTGEQNVRFECLSEDGESPHSETITIEFVDRPSFSDVVNSLETAGRRDSNPVRCLLPEQLTRYLLPDGFSQDDVLAFRCDPGGKDGNVSFLAPPKVCELGPIIRIAHHFARLATAAAVVPSESVSRLPMMSDDELDHILVELNGPAAEFPRATIPEAIEQAVLASPSVIAVNHNGRALTYRELHARAARLARTLQRRSVGPEATVAVLLDDPLETAIMYVAVVMAGGVIVPLDAEWPSERIAVVIRECDPCLIVTNSSRRGSLSGEEARFVVREELEEVDEAVMPKAALTPDNAAYIVFTSGSTGSPKGIVGLHRTVTGALPLTPSGNREVFSLSADLAFGAGVIGFFFALIQGATILLVSRQDAKDPSMQFNAWNAAGVTRIVMVPPQLRQLSVLGRAVAERLSSLRLVSFSGAALTTDLIRTARTLFPAATITNNYSCLEVGRVITRWELSPQDAVRSVNIGRVLPNTKVYILGPDLNPLPLGMPGEIYTGSSDLSRGYLNRPGLTAERFISNPFTETGLSRLYRTGDVGRLLPSGELEYLGRMDHQVKVRGIRVEIEELEAALHENAAVHQAAVSATPHAGNLRLTAFVSAAPGCLLTIQSLREHVRGRLPEYMIPNLFVIMPELPMTGNGKIDRQRLPDPDTTRPELDLPYVAARDETEALVTHIWETELGISGIGIDDNLFELGADSLSIARIAVRMQQSFEITVSLTDLFEHATIRDARATLLAERKLHTASDL